MTSFSTTQIYEKQFEKLDKRQQLIVSKKMQKVVNQPELGKPLSAPMQNRRSERVENLRIIYEYKHDHVTFLYFDDRGNVYG